MDPWYKITTPRKEVREGRSFNPDEFAIAPEQIVAGTATEDYRNPREFFKRTCFTRALQDHTAMSMCVPKSIAGFFNRGSSLGGLGFVLEISLAGIRAMKAS